jgi:hypothetical protein
MKTWLFKKKCEMFYRCFWKDPKGDLRNYDKEAKQVKIRGD